MGIHRQGKPKLYQALFGLKEDVNIDIAEAFLRIHILLSTTK